MVWMLCLQLLFSSVRVGRVVNLKWASRPARTYRCPLQPHSLCLSWRTYMIKRSTHALATWIVWRTWSSALCSGALFEVASSNRAILRPQTRNHIHFQPLFWCKFWAWIHLSCRLDTFPSVSTNSRTMNQVGIRFVRSTLIVTMKILGKLDFSRLIKYCWLVLEWTIKGTNVEPVEGPKRFIVKIVLSENVKF